MKRSLKRAAAAAALLLTMAVTAVGCEQPMPPYDPATRTPTDENEVVFLPEREDYEYYNNYIELYDGDGDVYDIGDPYVFRYDGKYYLYTSLNGDKQDSGKIPCWVSENLVDWEWAGWAYDPHSTSLTSPSCRAFAPEVIYYKGWFYMCESRRGQGHFFFRSANPNGPFEQISDNLGMGIDGSFHLTPDGDLYFLSADTSSSGICWYAIDFAEDGEGNVEVQVDSLTTEHVEDAYLDGWTEGPGVFFRNGYEYMTYAGNHVDVSTYRIGYSYAEGGINYEGTQNLSSRWDNTTLVSSGIDNPAVPGYASKTGDTAVSNYRGLGHSSNVTGPDLDSIYTAYHNAGRYNHKNVNDNTGGTRKYNVTQYFTNDGYLLTNGLGNYEKTKPELPDYSADADALFSEGGYLLSTEQTEAVFTAELSFRLTDGRGVAVAGYGSSGSFAEISVNGESITYTLVSGGNRRTVATGAAAVSTNAEAVHTVKIVNGAERTEIWYDGVRAIVSEETVGAGRVGYGANARPSSTEFTNDAFGTSDFDAVKDLSGSWAAYAYMKGENVGFSIGNASVRADGVRQGERESTKSVQAESLRASAEGESAGEIPATALTLRRGDWVKYLVNAPAADTYALEMLVGRESAGCIFEVIIDNESIFKMEVPSEEAFGGCEWVNLSAGTFECGAGLHTLKVRVYDGTLDVVNFSTVRDAQGEDAEDPLTDGENTQFRNLVGRYGSFAAGSGLITSPSDVKTLYIAGHKGVSDFEFSVDVRIIQSGTNGGIMFRMNDYGYASTTKVTQEGWRGYYLSLNPNFVGLTKNNYTRTQQLYLGRPTSDFGSGNTVRVTVRAEGGLLTVSLDGVQLVQVFDPQAYLNGYVGLHAESGTLMVFSDYEYRVL